VERDPHPDSRPHPESIDAIARGLHHIGLPPPLLVDAARQAVATGDPAQAATLAAARKRRLLAPVVNATGVLLHTNLGRAPVAVHQEAGYANLELDLETGGRGSRSDHAATLLARACGADAALVVNNGAAAVLLALTALGAGRECIVSRGELVEIGGGFRIPEVLAASGARLVEVGTTNRTRVGDYASAVNPDTALLLKVHASNYRITGFTSSVAINELTDLGVPVVADLGSGLLDAACPWLPDGPPAWLRDEPAVAQTLRAGAGLVTFSGDKLLGGPQAGIIAGRSELVARCAGHPLARALRPGGLVLAALQETALAYLRREPVLFWRLATVPAKDLRRRAAALGVGAPVDCESVTGGGTLPGVTIPSAGIALPGDRLEGLRSATPPVVARVDHGRTICDLRTVLPEQDVDLKRALAGG
jgi:L-seryl-tRNA(Ser) seleniumtransferase